MRSFNLVEEMRSSRSVIGIALISCAGLAGLIVSWAMAWGPWTIGDSVGYIEGARNLADGLGFVVRRASGQLAPWSFHPPLYSILLSPFRLAGLELILAAKLLNIVLFTITILFLGLVLFRSLDLPIFALVISVLMLSSPQTLMIFTGVMSEPLYLATSIASLLLLVLYLRRNLGLLLVASGFLAALSALTRYIGIHAILTGSLILLIFLRKGIRERLMLSLSYLLVPMIPLILWIVAVRMMGGTPAGFEVDFADLWERGRPIRGAIVDWLWQLLPFSDSLSWVPYRTKALALAAGAFACMAFASSYTWRVLKKNGRIVLAHPAFLVATAYLLYSLTYAVILITSFLFSSQLASAPSPRHLLPIQIGLLIGAVSFLSVVITRAKPRRVLLVALVAAALIYSADQFRNSWEYLERMHAEGGGYTSQSWQSSGVIQAIRDLPPDLPIISNEQDAIMLYTNRPAYAVPELEYGIEYPISQQFGQDPKDEIQTVFRDQGAALALFSSAYWQFFELYGDAAGERLERFKGDLLLHSSHVDGEIYFYRTSSAK
jgi:hypothetical protein